MANPDTAHIEWREIVRRKLAAHRAISTMFDKTLKLVENAETRLTNVTTQMGEMSSSSGAHDKIAEQLIILEDQIERLRTLADKYARVLDESIALMEPIVESNPTVARVMIMRYLEPDFEPSFREIASELGVTEDYARRLHGVGLDIIAENLCENFRNLVTK